LKWKRVYYSNIPAYSSCTGCSEANADFGGSGCYNNFSGKSAAFNCDDGIARQLYL